jgi:RNA polymerase sigma-70 factor (ECF subfamily)
MRREAVETAVSRLVELSTVQRSVVILKDALDQSLEEIADTLDLTVNAVKAHLARGRARLKVINARPPVRDATAVTRRCPLRLPIQPARLGRTGALRADDVRLVQSAYPPRGGAAEVGMFFSIYA